ncbi:hypothetical protein C8R43DRAFT_527450 [Mycena crocata]|nr:hypothetical protein C8R43DRAFT_527450 [Mycena crocata]
MVLLRSGAIHVATKAWLPLCGRGRPCYQQHWAIGRQQHGRSWARSGRQLSDIIQVEVRLRLELRRCMLCWHGRLLQKLIGPPPESSRPEAHLEALSLASCLTPTASNQSFFELLPSTRFPGKKVIGFSSTAPDGQTRNQFATESYLLSSAQLTQYPTAWCSMGMNLPKVLWWRLQDLLPVWVQNLRVPPSKQQVFGILLNGPTRQCNIGTCRDHCFQELPLLLLGSRVLRLV